MKTNSWNTYRHDNGWSSISTVTITHPASL